MKILMTTMALDLGGAETHIVELAKELVRRGHSVAVASNGGRYVETLESFGVRHYSVPMHRRSPACMAISAFKLVGIIRRERPDLVHSHARIPAMISGLVCALARVPMVTTTHYAFEVNGILRKFSNWGRKSLVVSQDLKDYLMREYDMPEDSIFPTVNGIDTERFRRNPEARDAVRREYGLARDAVVVSHISRLDPEPAIGADALIRAVPAIFKFEPRARFLIVGGGSELSRLTALADEVNAKVGADAVTICGVRLDAERILAASDLFVGISRSALEALSAELPVVLAGGLGYLGIMREEVLDDCVATNFTCRGFEKPAPELIADDVVTLLQRGSPKFDGRSLIMERYSVGITADTALRAYRAALKKRYGVALCGAYGMGNVGDEAILSSILAEIREVDPDVPVWVFSKRPKSTAQLHHVRSAHTFNICSFFAIMGRVSVYLNGGGNLIQDDTSRRSLWFYLYTLLAARMRGAKTLMYGCGIGPVNYRFDRWAAGRVINACADAITLREDGSALELQELGVTRPLVRLSADPVLALEPADDAAVDAELTAQGLDPNGRYACFALRPWRGVDAALEAFKLAASYVRERYGFTPLFFPVDGGRDAEINEVAAARCSAVSLREITDPKLAIGVLGRMRLMVSMRLHGLIFGANQAVPLVGVAYEPKVTQFMRYIGLDDCIDLGAVTSAALTAAIDSALSRPRNSSDSARASERVNVATLREILEQ
ncbi:MAG: polysaccharide pyruvyl transferase CsaB [Oscillospiraceae bacterium]|jgi:polysaccharide pyruvyl transferase CsaB|nr:polysaccharide pyruvyl transferase CsaB [Oscillospiraceae bacterium]